MAEAFESDGILVEYITGRPPERRAAISKISRKIARGIHYDFMYSESTTRPTYMPEIRRLTLRPCFDFQFFRFLNRHQVPIGLFYRDIYWRFPEYKQQTPVFKGWLARHLYQYDLHQYEQTVSRLYLPSLEMARYIPIKDTSFCRALPPGHSSSRELAPAREPDGTLRLLYVGGLGVSYQMQKAFTAIASLPHVCLTVCTRREEWEQVRRQYPALPLNIQIVHCSGSELQPLYDETDITLLFVKPHEYWQINAPLKLFEYLGEGKPIIAVQGTRTGMFVQENRIGWTIPYDDRELTCLLQTLAVNPTSLKQAHHACLQLRNAHTWIARAQMVARDLRSLDCRTASSSLTD